MSNKPAVAQAEQGFSKPLFLISSFSHLLIFSSSHDHTVTTHLRLPDLYSAAVLSTSLLRSDYYVPTTPRRCIPEHLSPLGSSRLLSVTSCHRVQQCFFATRRRKVSASASHCKPQTTHSLQSERRIREVVNRRWRQNHALDETKPMPRFRVLPSVASSTTSMAVVTWNYARCGGYRILCGSRPGSRISCRDVIALAAKSIPMVRNSRIFTVSHTCMEECRKTRRGTRLGFILGNASTMTGLRPKTPHVVHLGL